MFKNWKSYLVYIIPTIIVMCVNCTYNIIDQMFVGNIIGPLGLTALQTVGPLLLFLSTAFAAVFNSGSAVKVSQSIGMNNINEANNYFGNMIWCHIFWCVITSTIAFLFLNTFLSFFNISSTALTYAKAYGSIMVFGSVFSALGPSLAFILKNYGHPIISMFLISTSLILNIILDIILIPKIGIRGAAIGTVGSQFILVILDLITLYFTIWKKFNVKKFNLTPRIKNIYEIVKRGIPGLGDPISVFGTMLLHNIAITYYYSEYYLPVYNCLFGMDAIAMAIVIVSSVLSLGISGIILGVQPLLSKSYGEKNEYELKNVFKFSSIFILIFGVLSTLLFAIFNKEIPLLFGLKGDLFTLAAHATLISCFTYMFFGIVKVFYIYYQSIKWNSFYCHYLIISSLIAYIDILIVMPLTLYLLPKMIGLNGIWLALPISKFIMLLLIIMYLIFCKIKKGYFIETNM